MKVVVSFAQVLAQPAEGGPSALGVAVEFAAEHIGRPLDQGTARQQAAEEEFAEGSAGRACPCMLAVVVPAAAAQAVEPVSLAKNWFGIEMLSS